MATWDETRITELLIDHGVDDSTIDEMSPKLVELLGSVRVETVGWAWAEACQQYDSGRDPRIQPIPELAEKADADLNPERDP